MTLDNIVNIVYVFNIKDRIKPVGKGENVHKTTSVATGYTTHLIEKL